MEKMKNFNDFIGLNINYNGFSLGARDAYDTYKNIMYIFNKKTGWFSVVKPIHINDLKKEYKKYWPDMEIYHPGVIDKMIQVGIVKQLGFPVINDMVYMGNFAIGIK